MGQAERLDQGDENKLKLAGGYDKFTCLLAVAIAVFHLFIAIVPVVSELTRNILHFAGFGLLCFLFYPFRKHDLASPINYNKVIINGAFAFIVASSAIYLIFAQDAIMARGVKLITLDRIAIVIAIIGAIELARRTTGWIIPCLIILALSYVTWLGPHVEGVFKFRGLNTDTVLFRAVYGDDALFGGIASISATYVFLFILFGAFLLRSGAGDFVIELSKAVASKYIGGPGFVAVIASGLTGTISGSAVANTASTGIITIPMMKKAGFPAKFSAAIEASSSTGGQLMPPIMGAGAFVMASYTQIAYEKIIAVSAIPALLYFLSVAIFVRIEAKKQNLQASTENNQPVWQSIKNHGASFILPIGLLIILLVQGFTPTYAAVFGIIAVIISSWLTKTPMGPKAVFEALILGTKNMIMTAVLLCAVGIIINVISTAGIGNTFSLMIVQWANGNVLFAIILIGLASLVLGMGLPVTAAYIVLATLSAPALAGMISDSYVINMIIDGSIPVEQHALFLLANPDASTLLASPMGSQEAIGFYQSVPDEMKAILREQIIAPELLVTALLSAHMIIFWLSQDSNVTPPVCLASFTAAAIAKSPPMQTGFTSWKIAKGLYIIPILFAYTPLLSGDWWAAIQIGFFAIFGIYLIASGLQGHMENKLNSVMRIIAIVIGLACLWPILWVNLVGLILAIGFIASNVLAGKSQKLVTT